MLAELRIKDLLLIEEAELSFDSGFIVFTGETGAGKSLLVKAIKLILGEKGGSGLLREGAKEGVVEALFIGGDTLAERLSALGFSPEEELHIKRIFTRTRQKTYVNGSPITLSELKELTKGLVSLTSQHEFYSFLSPENYLEILDLFAGLKELTLSYKKVYEAYKKRLKELEELEKNLKEAEAKKEFLLYQLRELEELNPSPDEEEELLRKREKLKNLSTLKEILSEVLNSLEVVERELSIVTSGMEKLTQFESSFKDFLSKMYDFYYESKELSRELTHYGASLPEDDSELEEVEERLARYERLKAKHRTNAEGLRKLVEALKKELELIERGEEGLSDLRTEVEELGKKALSVARKLSRKRLKAASELKLSLAQALKELGMEKVVFEVRIISKEPKVENLSQNGLDVVELLFSSNPGIPPQPLHRVASGGELSRIFLACRGLLRGTEEDLTFVFDEVDTGIGGITAKKVGEKLKELSRNSQVLCITHLPQIAALADEHYVVEKRIEGERTYTKVRKISGEERLREIARMLGNPEDLELARNFLSLNITHT